MSSDWVETSNGNRISRTAVLDGTANIVLKGNCTVHEKVVINGNVDVVSESKFSVSIGKYCTIGKNTTINPPVLKIKDGVPCHSPVKIGSYVIVGQNCTLNSVGIGSRVVVEDDCVLSDLSILYDCCIVRKGTIVPPKMVIPPFSEVSGVPGKDFRVKELATGYKRSIELEAKEISVVGTRG